MGEEDEIGRSESERLDEIAVRASAAFAAPGASGDPLPVFLIGSGARREAGLAAAPDAARAFAEAAGFDGAADETLIAPDADGKPAAALVGLGAAEAIERVGALPRNAAIARLRRPVRLVADGLDPAAAAVEWALGAYAFAALRRSEERSPAPARLVAEPSIAREAARIVEAVYLARDLVNTPTSHLGPEALEAVVAAVAARHGARFRAIVGDRLLEEGYPMIHAVGRAGPEAPRLAEFVHGREDAPKVTLVGKGVCFDTGGLDIKPSAAMRNMKKDMGGAAAVLALARMVMSAGLPVRLRVLIPIVENSISASSFRPGDVLPSRGGPTVEIGNTDAEGRLILADALSEADREAPDLLIDMATLTGAARVAMGPDVAPFFTRDDALAADLLAVGEAERDPLWRLPLWKPYEADLASKVADLCNVSSGGQGGAIVAALFLQRFVEKAGVWAHFDVFAWNPKSRPGRPEGGEATAARALFAMLARRYPAAR